MRRIGLAVAVLLAGAVLLAAPRRAPACGPFFNEAYFTYTKHPDLPLAGFAAGRLGILEPSYARSYLAVAYRWLSRGHFEPDEQAALVAVWQRRLTGGWDVGDNDRVKAWADARDRVPGLPPAAKIDVYRKNWYDYQWTTNCNQDAFRGATQTLAERVATAPAEEVRAWVLAQDMVFDSCDQAAPPPPPLPASASPGARADRAYQIAAALLYRGELGRARRAFDAIAADASSPWSELAPYLAARVQQRAGDFADVERRTARILADPALSASHAEARKLANAAAYRLHPMELAHRLAAVFAAGKPDPDLIAFELDDYVWLMDRALEPADGQVPLELAALRADDITDWIVTLQAGARGRDVADPLHGQGLDHALERWRRLRTLPWLIAALTLMPGDRAADPELLAAAAAVGPDSPGQLSALFHAARLGGLGGGDPRAALDAALARTDLPRSARNRLLGLRMTRSHDLDEMLRFAPRMPSGVGAEDLRELDDTDEPESRVLTKLPDFDSDAARILGRGLPLARLYDAARSPSLPPVLARRVALATFVRAIVLDQPAVAAPAAVLAGNLEPMIAADTHAYLTARDPEQQRFRGQLAILRFPGLRPYVTANLPRTVMLMEIDDYRDNWWCKDVGLGEIANFEQVAMSDSATDPDLPAPPTPPFPPPPDDSVPMLASSADRAQLVSELQRLTFVGAAPDYLGAQVIAYAQRHRDDPDVPEALHRVVRATRWGCTTEATSKISHQAFRILYQRYPKSPWTEKTPYWF